MQKASVGRIVHYVSYGTPGGEYSSECRAAIVTEIPEGHADPHVVGLCVLNPTGQFFNRTPYDEGHDTPPFTSPDGSVKVPEPSCDDRWHYGGTWHWPART